MWKLYVAGAVALSTISISLLSIRTIDAGEVAVVTRFGAVTGRVLQPGASLITPFIEGARYVNTKFLIYETMKNEDIKNSKSDYKDGPVDTNTKDGQQVNMYYTIRFSIDSSKATWVVEKFGSEEALVDKIVRATSRSVARIVPSNFTAEELYVGAGKEGVGKEIDKEVRQKFAENGLFLDSVLIREIDFANEYTRAIEQKQIAAVQVETEKNKAEQAKFRKEASITEAEAQSRSQLLQRETISDQLLRKLWIEKWNGILPTYMTGGDASLLLQLPR